MKVFVMSRFKLEAMLEKHGEELFEHFDVISIFCTSDVSPIKEDRPEVLKVQFDDVDRSRTFLSKNSGFQSLKAMDEDQAKKILNFIENCRKDLIIHCHAGVSRSGAVGEFCQHYFKATLAHDGIYPNAHVYSTLIKVYNERNLNENNN